MLFKDFFGRFRKAETPKQETTKRVRVRKVGTYHPRSTLVRLDNVAQVSGGKMDVVLKECDKWGVTYTRRDGYRYVTKKAAILLHSYIRCGK